MWRVTNSNVLTATMNSSSQAFIVLCVFLDGGGGAHSADHGEPARYAAAAWDAEVLRSSNVLRRLFALWQAWQAFVVRVAHWHHRCMQLLPLALQPRRMHLTAEHQFTGAAAGAACCPYNTYITNRYNMLCNILQSGSPVSFEQLEAELLKGQKLQGVLTSNEVQVRMQDAVYRVCTSAVLLIFTGLNNRV
jgi:hypothetical protein